MKEMPHKNTNTQAYSPVTGPAPGLEPGPARENSGRANWQQLLEPLNQRSAGVRREFINNFSIALVFLVPLFYVIRLSVGSIGRGSSLVALFSVLAFATVPFILRFSKHEAVAGTLLFSTITVMTIFLVTTNGGLHAPVLAIIPCLPVLAAFLFGIRIGLRITGGLIFLLAVLAICNSIFVFSEPTISGTNWAIARTAMISLTLLMLILVVWYYERQHRLLVEDLRHGATHDPLTGLANRAALSLCLKQALAKLDAKAETSLSIIMFDIDHFKSYNDEYGHQCGDRTLQEIARISRQAAKRESDVVARFGGDEFVIVLPNTDSDDALLVARRLQQLSAELPVTTEQQRPVTLSIGVATTNRHGSARLGSELLERADQALYRAKEQGRDRISVHSHHGAELKTETGYRSGELST